MNWFFRFYCWLFQYHGTAVVASSRQETDVDFFSKYNRYSVLFIPDTALCNVAKYGTAFVMKFDPRHGLPIDINRFRDFLSAILKNVRLSKKEWDQLLYSEIIVVLPVSVLNERLTKNEMKEAVSRSKYDIPEVILTFANIAKINRCVSLVSSNSITNGFICNGIDKFSVEMTTFEDGFYDKRDFSYDFLSAMLAQIMMSRKYLPSEGRGNDYPEDPQEHLDQQVVCIVENIRRNQRK